MKNTQHYSLVATRAHLLSRIWSERKNMTKYPTLAMQYRHVVHELTCVIITIDASLGRGEARDEVAVESGRLHRDYVGRAVK
jgi:hypothetical protein